MPIVIIPVTWFLAGMGARVGWHVGSIIIKELEANGTLPAID